MLTLLFRSKVVKMAKPKILLIEDDHDIRLVTGVSLEIGGVGELLEASTGLDGVEMARTQLPDVILLDLRLSDMSGDSVLRLLKGDPLTAEIPVILFTGFAGDLDSLKGLHVADLVLKPFHPQWLCTVIRRTLASPREQDIDALHHPDLRRASRNPAIA